VAVLLVGFPANIHRNFLRPTCTINQTISLARRRVIHVQRVAALRDLISAV
jgi:putative transposase